MWFLNLFIFVFNGSYYQDKSKDKYGTKPCSRLQSPNEFRKLQAERKKRGESTLYDEPWIG